MLSDRDVRGDDSSIVNDSVLVGFLSKGISTDAFNLDDKHSLVRLYYSILLL